MNEQDIIRRVEEEIRLLFAGDATGHDAFHTLRVYRGAMRIAQAEGGDRLVIALGALLHDADDPKLFRTADFANARAIMARCGVGGDTAERVVEAIRTVSFKGTDTVTPATLEGKIIQDADRLDALGAIGAARAFAYGGSHGRAMYDPNQPPRAGMDETAYRANRGSSLNHFHEKLYLLKGMMNTPAARALAEGREAFLRAFEEEFLAEWDGRA